MDLIDTEFIYPSIGNEDQQSLWDSRKEGVGSISEYITAFLRKGPALGFKCKLTPIE